MSGSLPRTLLIGAVSGLVAGYVMERVQSAIAAGHEKTGDMLGSKGDEPATEKAADLAALIATGRPNPQMRKAAAGRVVHYVTASGLGALYGLLVRRTEALTSGLGLVFGLAVSLFLDETIVPALGLSPSPFKTSLTGHLDGLAGHAVFGVSLEAARKALHRIIPTA